MIVNMSEPRKRVRKEWEKEVLCDNRTQGCFEYMATRTDVSKNGPPMSGKQRYRCPHYNRFKCKLVMWAYTDPDGADIVEKCGEHDHDPGKESFFLGLPDHVKKKM